MRRGKGRRHRHGPPSCSSYGRTTRPSSTQPRACRSTAPRLVVSRGQCHRPAHRRRRHALRRRDPSRGRVARRAPGIGRGPDRHCRRHQAAGRRGRAPTLALSARPLCRTHRTTLRGELVRVARVRRHSHGRPRRRGVAAHTPPRRPPHRRGCSGWRSRRRHSPRPL